MTDLALSGLGTARLFTVPVVNFGGRSDGSSVSIGGSSREHDVSSAGTYEATENFTTPPINGGAAIISHTVTSLTNAEEYIAGTHPMVPGVGSLLTIAPVGSGFLLSVLAIAAVRQSVSGVHAEMVSEFLDLFW